MKTLLENLLETFDIWKHCSKTYCRPLIYGWKQLFENLIYLEHHQKNFNGLDANPTLPTSPAPCMGCWRWSRSRSRTPPPAAGLGRFDADNLSSADSESDESSSESGSASSDNAVPHVAQLSLSHLAALKASSSANEEQKEKVFAENGVKTSRIQKVLSGKKHSGCQCDKQCLFCILLGTNFWVFGVHKL